MARIFLFFVILVAVSGSKQHPKFRRNEEIEGLKKVSPNFVWLKRCVGVCSSGSTCVSTSSKMEPIPVRVYNAKTKKEYCGVYEMEVHESCGCCDTTAEDCTPAQRYNHPETDESQYQVESI